MKLSLERYAQIGFGVAALTIVLTSIIQYDAMRALGVSGEWVAHTSQVIQEVAATRLLAKRARAQLVLSC